MPVSHFNCVGWFMLYCWCLGSFSKFVLMFLIMFTSGLGLMMFFELWFFVMLLMLFSSGSSQERGNAINYFIIMNFVLAFSLLSGIGWGSMSVICSMIVLCKLPLFGLHSWLLKVHVEANMMTSMLLAGLVLKVGSLFVDKFVSMVMISIMFTFASVLILMMSDSKLIVGMSSVLHMSMCVFFGCIWYGSFTHCIVSPLMFMLVYLSYTLVGNRGVIELSVLLVFMNLSFPFMGAFFSEMNVVYCSLSLTLGYFMSFLFSYKMLSSSYENGFFVMMMLLMCIV